MAIVAEPAVEHRCSPPRHRPKSEWRTVNPPAAFMRPKDRSRAKPMPIPTAYAAGAVWLCSCGQGWIYRAGEHCGRNPRLGHREGDWTPVKWWNRQARRAIRAHMAQDDYRRAAAIVASFKPGQEV